MTNNMFFIANWKMFGDFKSINSTKKVVNLSKIKKYKKVQIIYCPPYTLLDKFLKITKNSNIKIGAQNCHHSEKSGAFTGSINADLIKSIGAKYVIIGHSENRISGDTNRIINLKIKTAIKKKLKIIFCIGETLREKRNNKTNLILNSQIVNGLKGIKKNNNLIFAYEPVWSIGTGIIPKNNNLEKQVALIKKMITKFWKLKNPKIIYGGSVNTKNIDELKKISSINGFLIGGASQDAKNFIDIIKKTIN
ncbi:triose-phosphate isomerase [Candidatus Pelagibacter sp.]|nr:triose-phosphate isomerase [Candidatus Pelagibacter sp.]